MEKQNRIVTDFTTGSVPKKMLIFAFPLVLSGFLQTVYSMVDMIVVGKLVGGTALSAVSIGGDILTMRTFASMGISNAGQIIISQYIGANMKNKVTKLIGTLFVFLLGCSVFIMGICLVERNGILRLINTPPEAWDYAMERIPALILS